MKKYVVIFRWYKDYYNTELLMKRTYYVKANSSKDAEHIAFEKFDKEFKLQDENRFYNLNTVDEISIKDLSFKRKHRKDRYNILYTL